MVHSFIAIVCRVTHMNMPDVFVHNIIIPVSLHVIQMSQFFIATRAPPTFLYLPTTVKSYYSIKVDIYERPIL